MFFEPQNRKREDEVDSETAAILALGDQVEENWFKIEEIALVQETIVERLDTINAYMQIMMAKLDASLGLNDPNNIFLQPIPDYNPVPVDPWVHYPSQEYPPMVCNELEQAWRSAKMFMELRPKWYQFYFEALLRNDDFTERSNLLMEDVIVDKWRWNSDNIFDDNIYPHIAAFRHTSCQKQFVCI